VSTDAPPETPEYVADSYVVDHHDPDQFIVRCPDCEETTTTKRYPGSNDRVCADCDRLMGVTPVRPQRPRRVAITDGGEEPDEADEVEPDGAGEGRELPDVAYAVDSRGSHSGKLHLDDECGLLTTDDPVSVPLSTMPPVWRRWSNVCGPEGSPKPIPAGDSNKCAECGHYFGDAAFVEDVCLGCHEPDDEPEPRVVTDGGGNL